MFTSRRPLRAFLSTIFAAQAIVAQFMETFKEFPPRQKTASFNIDQKLEKMSSAASGAWR
jgi:hypothetical protein